MIKHIWFDLSGTLTEINKVKHDELRYSAYSKIVKKPLDSKLADEYQKLLADKGRNAAVFRSLGLRGDFWGKIIESADVKNLYFLLDPKVPEVLLKLKAVVPISLFTNIRAEKVLNSVGIRPDWFTYIIQAGDIMEPKPALEGFKKIVELTKTLPSEILYVGDSEVKDILPAKSVGMKTCLMWANSREADYCYKDFKQLVSLMTNL